MTESSEHDAAERHDRAELRAGIAALGGYHIALGTLMASAPHSFFAHVGPFGKENDHYIRDVSTFTLALGVVLLVAVVARHWRVPILTYALVQFTLHTLNHLRDINGATKSGYGVADFLLLAAATGAIAWLLRLAWRTRPRGHTT